MIRDVYYFNETVLGIAPKVVGRLPLAERAWLQAALYEEVTELKASTSLEEDVDAIIDLIYFAIGGLYRLGLTEQQAMMAFMAVHDVNCRKKLGVKPTRPNDGSVADAIKPADLPDPLVKIREIMSYVG